MSCMRFYTFLHGFILFRADINMECYLSYLKGHTGDVNSLSASNMLLASGSEDGTIRIWDTSTDKSIRRLTDPSFFPQSPIENVSLKDFSLLASSNETLYSFDIRNPSQILITQSIAHLKLPDTISQINQTGNTSYVSLDNGCISKVDLSVPQIASSFVCHENVLDK
jgi:WD40 repeat protein